MPISAIGGGGGNVGNNTTPYANGAGTTAGITNNGGAGSNANTINNESGAGGGGAIVGAVAGDDDAGDGLPDGAVPDAAASELLQARPGDADGAARHDRRGAAAPGGGAARHETQTGQGRARAHGLNELTAFHGALLSSSVGVGVVVDYNTRFRAVKQASVCRPSATGLACAPVATRNGSRPY